MPGRLLCCIICISLCATAYAEKGNTDPYLEAALQERQVWNAHTPSDANEALIRKAGIYASARLWKEAAATLGRVRMYMLGPEEREKVLRDKEKYFFLSGDLDAAAAIDTELGDNEGEMHKLVNEALSSRPSPKNPQTAMLLSLVPGLGLFYAGRYGEGVLSVGLNACAIAWTVTQIASGCYISGIVGGAIALNGTYLGGMQRAAVATERYNCRNNPVPEL